VTLPIASDAVMALGAVVPATPVGAEPQALAGLRLVIVDDEADVRSVVARLLEQLGADVVALESGVGLDEVLVRFAPHVLLVDIGMPAEDGYALVQRIRRLTPAAGGQVPAISLTAHARNEDRARAMASGFQAHLAKPVDLAALVAAVRNATHAGPVGGTASVAGATTPRTAFGG
jgi:CheY-like chemotaxis protein